MRDRLWPVGWALAASLAFGCAGSSSNPSLVFNATDVTRSDATSGDDGGQPYAADAGDGSDGADASDSPDDAVGSDGSDAADLSDITEPDVLIGEEVFADDAFTDAVDIPDVPEAADVGPPDIGVSDSVDIQLPDVPPSDADGSDGLADVDPGDAGPADVEPDDLASDDVDPADVGPADTGPDVDEPDIGPPPAEGRLYRLTTLGWVSPPLCFPSDDADCNDITEFANGFLDDIWNDSEDPTDVGIDLASTVDAVIAAQLGGLECVRENDEIVGCLLVNPPPPASFDVLWTDAPGSCDGLSAPCFQTGGTVGSIAIQVGDFQIGLSNASVAAHVSGETPGQVLENGALSGFFPEKIAKTLTFNVGFVVSLAQLLEKSPMTVVNGQPGWQVVMTFLATEVPAP